jgi:hypothetical protein
MNNHDQANSQMSHSQISREPSSNIKNALKVTNSGGNTLKVTLSGEHQAAKKGSHEELKADGNLFN